MSERNSSFRHVPVVETMRGVFERTAVASEHSKRRRQELLQQHIQDARRGFTLRNFLLVLLDQHIITEADWTIQSSKKHAAHQATIDAVRRVLEALDNGEQPSLPSILRGKIDLNSIRQEKSEFESEIAPTNPNWNEFAFEIVCRLPFYKQFKALRGVLTAIARGEQPRLPKTLGEVSWWVTEAGGLSCTEKRLDIPYLRERWEWFKRNFIDPNEVLAKREPEANCKELAKQILLGKWPRETEPGPPTVPWDRIVDKLVGACSEKGMDAAFIREWVAREGEYAESDPRAAVLFQLNLAGVQYNLLAELRRLFPAEAKEWFDGKLQAERQHGGQTKIPSAKRTRPMSLREAARLMGYGASRDAAEKLRAAIDAGAVRYEKLTRQQHVFSIDDFSKNIHTQILPK